MNKSSNIALAICFLITLVFALFPWYLCLPATLVLWLVWGRKALEVLATRGSHLAKLNPYIVVPTLLLALYIFRDINAVSLALTILGIVVYKIWSDNRLVIPELLGKVPSSTLLLHLPIIILLMLPFVLAAVAVHELLGQIVRFVIENIMGNVEKFHEWVNDSFFRGLFLGGFAYSIKLFVFAVTAPIIAALNIIMIALYFCVGFGCIKVALGLVFRVVVARGEYPVFQLQSPVGETVSEDDN